ncbi:MAG: iron-containing alcohol dehydrogenase [Chloroflexi bacterium]|nr:iron-containing alcohol dehydrogenase [Chloroflexota bacterium]
MAYTVHCPTKLIFSDDAAADLTREAGALPPGGALVVTDEGLMRAGLAAPLIEALRGAGRTPETFSAIPSNPAVEDVRAAMAVARAVNPAVVVAVGGGSPIDVAKAVALLLAHDSDDWESYQWGRSPITNASRPVIAVPTTAGTGSEVTHVAVIGDHAGFKKGLVHPMLFARTAIVDGGLMRGLPPQMTAATGMDAFTHAVEAYLGRRHNPSMDMLALAALRAIVRWLPEATHRGEKVESRREMAQAALWAGMAMDQAGLGLCHALCGPLTSVYHLHHGLGNALLLPAVLAFNAEAVPAERWPALCAAVGLPESAAPSALAEWTRAFVAGLGLPTTLRAVNVESSSFAAMAEEATRMAMIGNNARPAGVAECRAVFEAAL